MNTTKDKDRISTRLRLQCLLMGFFMSLPILAENGRSVNAFLNTPELRHANVGVLMRNVRTGEVIDSYRSSSFCLPASTTKLVTTAAALELLGPEFRFKTTLQYDGEVRDSVLYGNLYILGGGDPTLGSKYLGDTLFLDRWCRAVLRLGVRHIKGQVIADASLFNEQGVSPKWSWEDLGNYYGMGVYGLSVYDNTCGVYYKSGKVGTQTEILRTEPLIEGLRIENHVTAASGGGDNAYYYGAPLSLSRTVYGTVPALKKEFLSKADIPNPPLLLSQQLTQALSSRGIGVDGNPDCILSHRKTASGRKTFFTLSSPPLRDIVENTNRLSNNHYAEHLYRYLGSRKTSSDVTAGAEVINEFWKSKGVDTDGLIQYDGSGLAPVNAITPEFLVNLLTWEYTQAKYGKVFYASLPVAGQTGTVKSLLRGTRLAGRVRCKSGSISRTQCYAGYVEWQGETYAFAVMVNNFRGSRERVKRAIGSLLLSLTDETVGKEEQEMDLHDDAPLESSDTDTEPSAE